MATRTVKTELEVDIGGSSARVKLLTKNVQDFSKEWVKLSKSSKLNEIENGLQAIGVGLGVVLVASVMAAAKYEQAVSKMQAATRATSSQMDSLKDATLAAGRGGIFSATEAAQAVTELGKASLSAQQIIEGGLKGALDLAAAGEMAVGEAAENAASAMSMFGLEATAVPHIADLLAAGAGKAQGEVKDMAQALNQTGLVAHQTGLSIEETTGALAAFANSGMIGSDAGTSFKTMLMRLSGPTAEAAEKMRSLGIDAYDAQGKFVGLANFAGQLKSSLSGLSAEQRNAALTTIFGADAVRAASIVYEQGADGIQSWIDKVNDSGYAAEQAALKNDNLMGDLQKLKGALEGALIGSGSGLSGALRDITKALTGVVNWFGALPRPVQTTITWFMVLSGAITGLLLLTVKLVPAFIATKAALLGMGAMGQFAAKAMTALGVAMRFTMGTVGLIALIAGVELVLAGLRDSFFRNDGEKPLALEIDEVSAALRGFATSGELSGKVGEQYGADFGKLAERVAWISAEAEKIKAQGAPNIDSSNLGYVWEDVPEQVLTTADALEKLTASAGPADEAFAQMTQNGYAGQAASSFADLRDKLIALGMTQEQVNAAFPLYSAAVLAAQSANTGLAQGFGTVGSNAQTMAGSLTEAMNQGQSLVDVFEALNGAATEFAGAEIDAEQAVDDFREAIEASNGSMDVNTEKGREAKQGLLDGAEAAAAAANAKYLETGSVLDATKVYDGYIGQLRKSMLDAGMNETVVDNLIETYAKMPSSIFVNLDTNADGVINDLDKLIRRFQMIPEYKNTTIYVNEQWTRSKLGADFADGGMVEFYAGGGMRRENHIAQIAPAGAWRVWAEDETGGEAYIPLSPAKRERSTEIWAEVGKRFGMNTGPTVVQSAGTTINATIQAYSDNFSLSQVKGEFAKWGVV
ncbi:phage tail tape measure protein [Phytomonospora sp. NPDC050363]|uniref:phage tail tape measure protein n=1 Tax=Phytomonospora sp. NPDC050363 TaxID=3155642 RepID=UPI0033E391D7